MKVVIDTNVLISGIFWSGNPHQILEYWKAGKIELIVSLEILEEYHRVAEVLSNKYPGIDIHLILELISLHSVLVETPMSYPKISVDPDDDKFMICAESSNTKIVISGDKHLLEVNGYHGISVLKPKQFLDKYFNEV